MVLRKLRNFIDELDNRRKNKEDRAGLGTIHLRNIEEFQKISDYYEGQLLSPGGAASHLGVSRAMIHQLERDGKIRTYRYRVEDKEWEHLPFYLKLLFSTKDEYIWIPVIDLDKYAEGVHKRGRAKSTKLKVKE